MSLAFLDSRASLGSDVDRKRQSAPAELDETSSLGGPWIEMREIRVILGHWGPLVRLSAPDLELIADGKDFDEAWAHFLKLVTSREDSPWLTFDVSPLRDDEISAALNAQEDEDWNEAPAEEA